MPQNCPFGLYKKVPNMGHWKLEESFILWWEKFSPWWSRWLSTLLAWQGDPTWDVFYTAQWMVCHHDLGCFFLQWNNGVSGGAEMLNGEVWRSCGGHPSWLRAFVCVVMTGISTRQCCSSLCTSDKWLLLEEQHQSFGQSCLFLWFNLYCPNLVSTVLTQLLQYTNLRTACRET